MQAQGSLLSPSGTKMLDMLSTAEMNPFIKTVIPIYIDGSPITDEGSVAYLDGALFQASPFYERTGHYVK